MPHHVAPDAVAEHVGAEILLDHPHHRRTLLVGDEVEVLGGLRHAAHRRIDGVRAGEPIEAERAGAVVLEALPHAPFGAPLVDHAIRHPGGERLVQPEVVPPRHGDQVAVPHVGQLVRDDLGGPFALRQRHGGRVDEQQRLAKEHRAGVLHRPGFEVRHCDHVELGVGVRDGEVVLETGQGLGAGLEREGGQMPLARDVPDADGGGSHVPRLARLERPDGEREEIRGERRRGLEVHGATAVVQRLLSRHRRVPEHRVRLGRGHGDVEAGLERRLVEAREDAPRIRRLALRERVPQVAGAGGIETAQVAIERAGEAQAQRGGAGRQRPGSAQRHGLVVPIEDDAQRNHLAVDLGVGVLDREIRGVEDDLRSGARQADVDADLAPEATRREIGLEVDVVVARPHVGGEPEAGRMRGARHGHRV